MGKEFKPITIEDFGVTPEQMEILVRGSQIFAGPHQAEPPDEQPEENDNGDASKSR